MTDRAPTKRLFASWTAWVALGGLVVAAVVARVLVGHPDHLFSLPSSEVLPLRTARIAMGLVVGGGLGLAGAMLQALLRNPLASPDLIGLSAGATLAVMVAGAVTGSRLDVATSWQIGPAFIGAIGGLSLVYVLGQRNGAIDPPTLILVGAVVATLAGAGVMLVHHLYPSLVWSNRVLVGGLVEETPASVITIAVVVLVVSLVLGLYSARAMDGLAMGEEEASSVGINVPVLRASLFIASGLVSAAAVVLAGPVGFVGLIAPHIARLLMGPHHRVLVIGATLAGGAVVVGSDALVKVFETNAGRIPLGVITAFIGAPALILLLRRGVWVHN